VPWEEKSIAKAFWVGLTLSSFSELMLMSHSEAQQQVSTTIKRPPGDPHNASGFTFSRTTRPMLSTLC
jgi:hypothetical protein